MLFRSNTKFITEDNQDVSSDIVIRAEIDSNPSQAVKDMVERLIAENGSAKVHVIYYDIKAYESNTNRVVKLANGSVKLKFAYSEGHSSKDELIVLHNTEQVSVEKEEDCFWITATGFSPYTIIYRTVEEADGDEDDDDESASDDSGQDKATSPKTYDYSGFERILPSDGSASMAAATDMQKDSTSTIWLIIAAILCGSSAVVFGILAARRKEEE